MMIAFAIIALIIISGLGISIYAIFVPFLQNIQDIQQYNIAYYSAIGSVERAMLVTRVQEFWFDGIGWRKDEEVRWPVSDHKPEDLWYNTGINNSMRRQIQWTTDRIPGTGQSNIPQIFVNNTDNYNKASYAETIQIHPTTKIPNPEQAYIAWENKNYTWLYIKTHRRVPASIWWQLCTGCDENNDEFGDDIIVLRQWQGKVAEDAFTITPYTDVDRDINIVGPNDTHIRKSIINNSTPPQEIPSISFHNTFHPLVNNLFANQTSHTWFGPWFASIQDYDFQTLWSNTSVDEVFLQYNIIQESIQDNGFVYPFLEYYVDSDMPISNTQRDITGHGKTNPYHVQVRIQKPQNQNIKWGDFSIVF